MLHERTRRSPSFQEGTEVRLADGNLWTLPAVAGLLEEGGLPGAGDGDLAGLLDAVVEAEDRSELLRAELALAIHLLGRNYRLGPAEYRAILEFPPRSPWLAESQQAFHDVAMDHVARLYPQPAVQAGPQPAWVAVFLAGCWTSLTAALRFVPIPRLLRRVRTRISRAVDFASR